MQIKDFSGLFKYKLIIPTVYILSWVFSILGPVFFEVSYKYFSVFMQLYMISKTTSMAISSIIIGYRTMKVLNKAENKLKNPYTNIEEVCREINHFFIIPNYKEPDNIMEATLQRIASHTRATSQYYVFLAMEEHEVDSDVKAQAFIARFGSFFKYMGYTRHRVKEYEQKGKASNVSWCAEHLYEVIEKLSLPQDTIFLTIIDVDSWVPETYYDEVEEYLHYNWDNRFKVVFQPPQIYTINNLDVPIITRVCDIIVSYVHVFSLFSFIDVTFPLSNYTLSYNLIKKVGFWDTCADAIGEDFHTMQKCIWKSQTEVIGVPIYTPFNQVNIQTGEGYFSDICARFWQAERHGQGVADVAYNLNQMIVQPLNWRGICVFLFVLECFALPPIISSTFLALSYQFNILANYVKESPQLLSARVSNFLFNVLSITASIPYPIYELIKRRSNKVLYQRENESIFRVLEYILFYPFVLLFITIPTFTISAFRTLFSDREYVVANKVLLKNVVTE